MVIVQANSLNQSAIRTVVCAAITSSRRLAGAPGDLRIGPREFGLPKASVVNVSQVLTADREFVAERIQALSARAVEQISEDFRFAMGL